MKKLLPILFFTLTTTAFAQNTTEKPVTATTTEPTVVVHKDARIDALIKKKASINKATKKSVSRTMRGYRLMVINTNSRDEAIAAKTKLYNYYPDLKSYLQYQTPYFKLKAGNFQTRDEAEKYRKAMASMFPKGVFIINDIIEVKGEKDSGDDNE
ncbi:MAG: SPOR domain-containing protein [Chitinophagaceae bacterium]